MKTISCQTWNSIAALDPKTKYTRRKNLRHKRNSLFSIALTLMFVLQIFMTQEVRANVPVIKESKVADGIGYREQEL